MIRGSDVWGSRVWDEPQKIGWKPDPDSLMMQQLRTLHPRVRLIWSPTDQDWALVGYDELGAWYPIARLNGEMPTYENTVTFLCRMQKLMEQGMEEHLIEEEQRGRQALQDGVSDRIGEGSERLQRELIPTTQVSMHGAHNDST